MGIFDSFERITGAASEARETASIPEIGIAENELSPQSLDRVELRTDVPGVDRALVIGNPFEAAERMDYVQGDNVLGYLGDCGLTSVANVGQLCGLDLSEDDVVLLANATGQCANDWFLPPSERGGVNDENIINLLSAYGIEAHAESADSPGGSLEAIAQYCENGQSVTMGLNAGVAWDMPEYIDDGGANHQVTVLGAVRDADTGEVAGLYICDSGNNEQCRFVDAETCHAMYTNVSGASIVVTDKAYA